jgi:hypothetical protein
MIEDQPKLADHGCNAPIAITALMSMIDDPYVILELCMLVFNQQSLLLIIEGATCQTCQSQQILKRELRP